MNSREPARLPMEDAVLDRHSLIATIESRHTDPGCPSALLLLVVLEDADGVPVDDAALVSNVARHVGAMIRTSDLIATLDAGELAMVVFDLPPIQRVAFADGIATAVNGVLETVAPLAGLRAFLGTGPLPPGASITDAFRLADRELRAESAQLASSGPMNLG